MVQVPAELYRMENTTLETVRTFAHLYFWQDVVGDVISFFVWEQCVTDKTSYLVLVDMEEDGAGLSGADEEWKHADTLSPPPRLSSPQPLPPSGALIMQPFIPPPLRLSFLYDTICPANCRTPPLLSLRDPPPS